MRFGTGVLAVVALLLGGQGTAQDLAESFVPSAVAADEFSALKAQSPFSRSLNLSDSLILTGIAMVDEDQVATLLNKETKETFVVSSQLNSQGWKMVDLKADEDLEKVAAKVSVDGGEVVTVRYGEWQLKPGEARPGAGSGEGGTVRSGEKGRFGGKGGKGGKGPPSEMREKMSKLSEEQRGKLFDRMRQLREKNPDMTRDEMRAEFTKGVDRLLNNQ